jgi:hypothetical protein
MGSARIVANSESFAHVLVGHNLALTDGIFRLVCTKPRAWMKTLSLDSGCRGCSEHCQSMEEYETIPSFLITHADPSGKLRPQPICFGLQEIANWPQASGPLQVGVAGPKAQGQDSVRDDSPRGFRPAEVCAVRRVFRASCEVDINWEATLDFLLAEQLRMN